MEPGTIIEATYHQDENLRCVVIPKRHPIEQNSTNLRVVLMEKGNDPELIVGRIFYINAETLQWECTEHRAITILKRTAILIDDMTDVERANFSTLINTG